MHFLCFRYGDTLFLRIDDDEKFRQGFEFGETAEVEIEFVDFAVDEQAFLLCVFGKFALFSLGCKFLKAGNTFLDFAKIGESTANPASGDIRHFEFLARFDHGFSGLTLASDYKGRSAFLALRFDEGERFGKFYGSLLKVEDFNLIFDAKNKWLGRGMSASLDEAEMGPDLKKRVNHAFFLLLVSTYFFHTKYKDNRKAPEPQRGSGARPKDQVWWTCGIPLGPNYRSRCTSSWN